VRDLQDLVEHHLEHPLVDVDRAQLLGNLVRGAIELLHDRAAHRRRRPPARRSRPGPPRRAAGRGRGLLVVGQRFPQRTELGQRILQGALDDLEHVVDHGREGEHAIPQGDLQSLDVLGLPELLLGPEHVELRHLLEVHRQEVGRLGGRRLLLWRRLLLFFFLGLGLGARLVDRGLAERSHLFGRGFAEVGDLRHSGLGQADLVQVRVGSLRHHFRIHGRSRPGVELRLVDAALRQGRLRDRAARLDDRGRAALYRASHQRELLGGLFFH